MQIDSLATLLQERAETSSGERFFYLENGEVEGPISAWSYATLLRKARVIAARLQQHRGIAGERVMLMYPAGLDYLAGFFGTMLAGAVAVPAFPPDPLRLERTLPRVKALLEDCGAQRVLTTSSFSALVRSSSAGGGPRASLGFDCIETDLLPDALVSDYQPVRIRPEDIAFLQYTSGSTSQPRGVVLTQANMMHNLRMLQDAHVRPDDVFVSWLPIYHDMGLIVKVLSGLHNGSRVYLMSPLHFLGRPMRWLEAMSRFKGTVSAGPNFAYELCARKAEEDPGGLRHLDLSSWQVAMNAAEPVRASTLERFNRVFAPCGFNPRAQYPSYGLAENTVMVSTPKRSGGARVVSTSRGERVACGTPGPDQEVCIVDPDTHQTVAPGGEGEVWIRGQSVARGYWNRDSTTGETFQAVRADGETGWMRTGDLALFEEGQLVITGRIKDLIILRGHNYYPQDIELTTEESDRRVRPGNSAAFEVDHESHQRLCVVAEIREDARSSGAEIAETLRAAVLRDHGIEPQLIALVPPRAVPKTSSGKIMRRACKRALLDGTLPVVHRWERAFKPEAPRRAGGLLDAMISAAARAVGVSEQQIMADVSLVDQGLDSQGAMEFLAAVERLTGRRVPPEDLSRHPSLRALEQALLRDPAAPSPRQPALRTAPTPGPRVAPRRAPSRRAGLALRPTITSIGRAFPGTPTPQAELYDRYWARHYDAANGRALFEKTTIEQRHWSFDARAHGDGVASLEARMKCWRETTLDIGTRSARQALAHVDPARIGSLIMSSCTGYTGPTPEYFIARELGLSPNLRRTFIGHMGCFAAFNCLKVGVDALMTRPGEAVLVNCTEICSVHHDTRTAKDQIVIQALFADASASAVMEMSPGVEGGVQILDTFTEQFYETADMMTWDLGLHSFHMTLSPLVPAVLREHVPRVTETLLEPHGLTLGDISHWGIHPGGPKIVHQLGDVLGLKSSAMDSSLRVLRRYGNCSSPTILMVLQEILETESPEPGALGVLMAFGPGLTCELALVQF